MRATPLLLLVVLSACDTVERDSARADSSVLTHSGGEVQLSDGRRLPYSVTSERYRQWDAAQRALDVSAAQRFGDLLESRNPSQESIDRAVESLENDDLSAEAITRAGLTVRDFVMTTVALEQEMRLASGQGRPRGSEPPPLPEPYPPVVDTFAPMPVAPIPASPYPANPANPANPYPVDSPPPPRVDAPRQVDTLYPTPYPMPATPVPAPILVPLPRARDTTPPRDTLRPRGDTAPPPSPPDTLTSAARRPHTP
ncbi:MAG: hypothetical protein WD801_07545 [Gemmatimonadaceae bacterium]